MVPRAGRSGIDGMRGDAWLVRLNTAPVGGAANVELVEILADVLDVPKRAVSIVAGERARQKRVRIEGMSHELVASKLMQRK